MGIKHSNGYYNLNKLVREKQYEKEKSRSQSTSEGPSGEEGEGRSNAYEPSRRSFSTRYRTRKH